MPNLTILRSAIQREHISILGLTEDELGIICFALDHYYRSGDADIHFEAGDLGRRMVYKYLHETEDSISLHRARRMEAYRRHLDAKGRELAARSGDQDGRAGE